MTFFSLVNAERVTVATDDPVVPAAEVDSLTSALDVARRLSVLHESAEARVTAAERKAGEAARREGLAVGRAAAAAELGKRLLELEGESEREREALRERAIDNALDIVRRVAATLGEADTLAALALEAARELMPCAAVVVQVHPDRLEPVRERLARYRASAEGRDTRAERTAALPVDVPLEVEVEKSLEPDQCRLCAPNGAVVLAGLETQLRTIERHARAAAPVGTG